MQTTSYLDHNTMSIGETFADSLVKIWLHDVSLRDLTWFSYIFPYDDVINESADVTKNNDVMAKVNIGNKSCTIPLLTCKTPSSFRMYYWVYRGGG